MKQYSFFILFLLFFGMRAQQYANEFLKIGVGANALGMSGGVTAQIEGIYAAYWNPAALGEIDSQKLGLMHASVFHNMAQLDYAVYGRKRDEKSGIALGILRFGVDNIMNTTHLIDQNGNVDYNRITYFSAADYALLFSYGHKEWFGKWDAGITMKLLYRHIGDFAQAFGFGFDAAMRRRIHNWTFAALLRDATTTFSFWSFNEERMREIREAIPGENNSEPDKQELSLPELQIGVAKYFNLKTNYGLTVELDLKTVFYNRNALLHTPNLSMEPILALEGHYRHKIFLRTGINNIYRTDFFGNKLWQFNPSAGVGIRFKYLQLDYAFTGMGGQGFFTHVFSLLVDLRLFKKEK